MTKRQLWITLGAVAGLILASGLVLSGSKAAQASPEDDIQATVEAVVDAWNAGDVDAFMTYWTDAGLKYQWDVEDRSQAPDAIAADMQSEGPIQSATVTDIFVTSGNASAIVDLEFGEYSLYEKWSFYHLDGGWKIGEGKPASKPIPAGVTPVPLTLQEYAFLYDKSAVASGNFAFQVTNRGSMRHEVLLLRLNTDSPMQEIVQQIAASGGESLPDGVEIRAYGGVYRPGEQRNLVLNTPLEPGRYGLVCFLPSTGGIPHAALGMVSDFLVGTGGGITPPSTGNGGLLPH